MSIRHLTNLTILWLLSDQTIMVLRLDEKVFFIRLIIPIILALFYLYYIYTEWKMITVHKRYGILLQFISIILWGVFVVIKHIHYTKP